jgi:hypothetical protein
MPRHPSWIIFRTLHVLSEQFDVSKVIRRHPEEFSVGRARPFQVIFKTDQSCGILSITWPALEKSKRR